jgi:hypothetical protein
MHLWIIAVVAIIALLAVVAAAFFWFRPESEDEDVALVVPSPIAEEAPAPVTEIALPSAASPDGTMRTYTNATQGFSFEYPVTFETKETPGATTPLVFLDTKPMTVPSAYGGPLTPVEVRTAPFVTEATFEEAAANGRAAFEPATYVEQPAAAGLARGLLQRGTLKGTTRQLVRVLFQGRQGPVVFDFLPGSGISEETFTEIYTSFRAAGA